MMKIKLKKGKKRKVKLIKLPRKGCLFKVKVNLNHPPPLSHLLLSSHLIISKINNKFPIPHLQNNP